MRMISNSSWQCRKFHLYDKIIRCTIALSNKLNWRSTHPHTNNPTAPTLVFIKYFIFLILLVTDSDTIRADNIERSQSNLEDSEEGSGSEVNQKIVDFAVEKLKEENLFCNSKAFRYEFKVRFI